MMRFAPIAPIAFFDRLEKEAVEEAIDDATKDRLVKVLLSVRTYSEKGREIVIQEFLKLKTKDRLTRIFLRVMSESDEGKEIAIQELLPGCPDIASEHETGEAEEDEDDSEDAGSTRSDGKGTKRRRVDTITEAKPPATKRKRNETCVPCDKNFDAETSNKENDCCWHPGNYMHAVN